MFSGKSLTGLIMAVLVAALVVVPFSSSASADGVSGAASGSKVWVEKNPPPPHAIPPQYGGDNSSGARPAATGGGCEAQANDDYSICISYQSTYPRVAGDFYRDGNSWLWVDTARVYFLCNGGTYYQYTVAIDHYGHYPFTYHYTSGSGNCFTLVDFYSGSSYQVTGLSPTVYYP
jgi:hypothetical protein